MVLGAMEQVGLQQYLEAASAVAALSLLIAWRRLPQIVIQSLLGLSLVGIFSTGARSAQFGLVYLFTSLLSLVAPGEGGGWLAVGLSGYFGALATPAHFILSGHARVFGQNAQQAIDGVWWSLLAMLAASALLTSRLAQSPKIGADRPISSFMTGAWPSSARATAITSIAFLYAFATHLSAVYLSDGIAISMMVAAAALVIFLRLRRPMSISWGAWYLAMGYVVQIPPRICLWALLTFDRAAYDRFATTAIPAVFVVGTFVKAALLIWGPRQEEQRERLGWIIYLPMFVLPGLGWLSFCYWPTR